MKLFGYLLAGLLLTSCATTKNQANNTIDQVVDASCGMCNFDMTGDECDLAVRIDNKAYYVEGTGIDEHGDSHAEDGFCNAIRKAQVVGEIKHGVFKAEKFELLPIEE